MKAVVFYTFVLIILYRFNPLDDPVAIQDEKFYCLFSHYIDLRPNSVLQVNLNTAYV